MTHLHSHMHCLSLPLLRCDRGYFGDNCTIEACSLPNIAQGECENQTCKMLDQAFKGYQCIPNESDTKKPCASNQTCTWNHTTKEIECLTDPCIDCGQHTPCEVLPLFGRTICHCRPGYDPYNDCNKRKPCDNGSEQCQNGGTCGEPDSSGLRLCTCLPGKLPCNAPTMCAIVRTCEACLAEVVCVMCACLSQFVIN